MRKYLLTLAAAVGLVAASWAAAGPAGAGQACYSSRSVNLCGPIDPWLPSEK